MTWTLFHGLMRKHLKECPPPSFADLQSAPPMGALSRDYGISFVQELSFKRDSTVRTNITRGGSGEGEGEGVDGGACLRD